MDDKRAPVTAKIFVGDDSTKADLKKAHEGQRFKKNGYTRPLRLEAWLQKPAHPYLQEKLGIQKDEDICQHH